jgi:hypothetical protein
MTKIIYFCLWPNGSWDEEIIETKKMIKNNHQAIDLFNKIHRASPVKPFSVEVNKIFTGHK